MKEAGSTVGVVYRPVKSFGRVKNLVGRKMGRWSVLALLGARKFECKKSITYYQCRCECGTVKDVSACSLNKNGMVSCGCRIIEATKLSNTTHGKTNTREYKTWCGLKERCLNPNNTVYPLYGGRGIKVCERWKNSFENFFADMGLKPARNYSIERKDVNGDYEPGNCIWATQLEQMHNYRKNVILDLYGFEKCLAEWARIYGMREATLRLRLKSGWSVEDALFTPVRQSSRVY